MDKKQKINNTENLSHSQNFITSSRLLQRIINLSNLDGSDIVWEIGSGKGHLTQALCRKCGLVYSVELDKRLFEKTSEKLSRFPNLKLFCGDFLKFTLPAKGNYKVFANIPYSITTPIIDKLTSAPNPPADIWLIMEKGAAKRFAGVPKETKKSLLLKVNWNMEIVYRFSRNDFHPMPSVDSVLIHFEKKPAPDLGKKEFASYKKFIEHSFKYGICGRNGLLTKKQASAALRLAKLPPLTPDGVTLYIQWLCLFRCAQKTAAHISAHGRFL